MVSPCGHAQFRFGGEVGFNYANFSGANLLDSITVNGTTSNQGELFLTAFAAQTFTKNFEVRGNVSVKPIYPSFVVYNSEAGCTFCPVQKVRVVGITCLTVEVLPTITIPLFKWLKTKVFIAPAINFNFVKQDPELHFGGKHEGVARVINSLDNSIKPINLAVVYGGSLEFKNVVAGIRIQMKSAYTENINVSGAEYDFKNSWQFVTFSIGYAFQAKKKVARQMLRSP